MRASAVCVTLFALGLISPSAFAADLPVKAPMIAPIYDWSGFYAGINLGYGSADSHWSNTASTPATTFYDAVPGNGFSNLSNGAIGGVQLGYNFQNGPLVYGVEAMFDGSTLKGSYTSTFGAGDDQFESKIKALFSFTGRVGYAWQNVLIYGKAGLAIGNVSLSVSDTVGPFTGAGSDSHWVVGPTVGGGVEYGLTPRLSLALEYDYTHLNSASYELGGGVGTYKWDVEQDMHVVTARLNYRFSSGH
jgi:outer membrane immunogenic protein